MTRTWVFRSLAITSLALASTASAQDPCDLVTPEMLEFLGLSPDTVDVVCPIPGDVLRIRLVPGEGDTLLIGPDGEDLPWPPDQGSLPDPDTWIDHFVGGVQPGDYLFAWNGVPFWIGEVTGPMLSLRAPSSGSFAFHRIGDGESNGLVSR